MGYYKKKWMTAGPHGRVLDSIIENLVLPFSELPVLPAGSRAEGPTRRRLGAASGRASSLIGKETL
jgi:hypothetical protein